MKCIDSKITVLFRYQKNVADKLILWSSSRCYCPPSSTIHKFLYPLIFFRPEIFLFLLDVAFGLVFLEMVFLDLSLSGEYPGRWSVLTSLIQSWLFSLLEGGSEFSSYEIKLQNQVKQNDVILQFTNSSISKEILLLSY